MYKILLAALISAWAFSSQASVESMQIQLKQKYPKLNIGNIQKTEMQGLYSATLDNQIIYIGENAEHFSVDRADFRVVCNKDNWDRKKSRFDVYHCLSQF